MASKSALIHARAKVGQKETNGKNRSPFIDAIIKQIVGGPLGIPWCAVFICWAFTEALKDGASGKTFPKTAGSQWLRSWAKQQGIYSDNAQDLKNWKGAIGGWTNPDGKHGHVFLVAGRLTDPKGKIVALLTVEGNSNRAGSRDGDGVVENRRVVPIDAGHRLWFIDTSDFAGGDFGWEDQD